ncbi:MAG: hypothetical protein MMC33_002069 [Icmadophila ericetorum]|nr:hypothetical protein [Icmadophila ericetorum]
MVLLAAREGDIYDPGFLSTLIFSGYGKNGELSPEALAVVKSLGADWPPILSAPDVVIPNGEFPYHSRISNKEAFLPVGVDIVGLPGSDLWLMDLLQDV